MAATERDAVDLDDVDLRLLEFIEADFDVNLSQLSDELGLSKSAVHYRIDKLKDRGVIQGVTADLDPLSFDLNMVAITEVTVDHETGYATDVGNQLAAIPGVNQVYYTMGDVDFVVISRVQDRDQLNTLIDDMVDIDGVNKTSSRFVMREIKSGGKTLDNLSTEMRERITGPD